MNIGREIGFDMGHMLPDHEGGCHRPHGHRYRLEVVVTGALTKDGPAAGMVVDFAVLKQVLVAVTNQYDHRFAVCVTDPRLPVMQAAFAPDDLVIVDDPPTAENLVTWLAKAVQDGLGDGYTVTAARLWETPTCWAGWER